MPTDPYAEFQSDPYAEFQQPEGSKPLTMRQQLDQAAAQFKANDKLGGPGSAINEAVAGLHQIWSGQGKEEKAAGYNRLLGAVGTATAPMGAIGAIVNPVAAIGALGGGLLGGWGGKRVAGYFGMTPDTSPNMAQAAGNTGSIIGGTAGGSLGDYLGPKVGGLLKDLAERQYGRVLNATTKDNKITSAEVVPQMIERGYTGNTIKGMYNDAAARTSDAGQAVSAAWGSGADKAMVPVDPIIDSVMAQAKATYQSPVSGVTATKEDNLAFNKIAELVDRLKNTATLDANGNRVMPGSELRFFRDRYYNFIKEHGGFAQPASDISAAGAVRIPAAAAANQINTMFPAVDAANSEYHLQKNIMDILEATRDRRMGQSVPMGQQLSGAAGMGAGALMGGTPVGRVAGAVVGRQLSKGGQAALASPFFNTRSAIAKDRLGGLLQNAPTLPLWLQGLLGNVTQDGQ